MKPHLTFLKEAKNRTALGLPPIVAQGYVLAELGTW